MESKCKGRLLKVLGGNKMNKEFRELLEDELCKVTEMNEDILSGYGAGVYDTYTYLLKKYDELHKPVVVPDFVAEWIESPDRDLDDMYVWERPKNVYEWTFGKSDSLENSRYKDLLDAITDGYEVEDKQKYYVINNQNYFLLAKDKGHGFVFSTGGNSKIGNTDNISATFKLTEQEIKDYDERYWTFAVKVEEVK